MTCLLLLQEPVASVVDKVCDGVFAPSTKLAAKDAIDLLTYCFGLPPGRSPLQLYMFIEGKKQAASVTHTKQVERDTVSPYSTLFAKQQEGTAYLTVKEASGSAMLADFLLCVWEVMKSLHPKSSFMIDHQYTIIPAKAIADGALCALMVSDYMPLLIIEYKPKVASTIDDIDVSDLTETMVQALYLRKRFQHPIVHCLTDLKDFHYFVLKDTQQKRLQIEKYVFVSCNGTDVDDLLAHVSFLSETLCIPLAHVCAHDCM